MRTIPSSPLFRFCFLFLAFTTSLTVASACHSETKPEPVCGGIAGVKCPDGQVCELPAGQCKSADLTGQCKERPEVCTKIFQPVCGCDGKTYPNDCERLKIGVQKDHDGECKTEPAPPPLR